MLCVLIKNSGIFKPSESISLSLSSPEEGLIHVERANSEEGLVEGRNFRRSVR